MEKENSSIIEVDLNARLPKIKQSIEGDCKAYCTDLQRALTTRISRATYVFGCVAWLTNPVILNALKGKKGTIVVQSEDFRPYLKKIYRDFLRHELVIRQFGTPSMSFCAKQNQEFYKDNRPILHHKFMLFGHGPLVTDMEALWIGSFNFTVNATNNLESAVVIKQGKRKKPIPAIATMYRLVHEIATHPLTLMI